MEIDGQKKCNKHGVEEAGANFYSREEKSILTFEESQWFFEAQISVKQSLK